MIKEVRTYLQSKTTLPVYGEDEPDNAPSSFLLVKNTVTGEYLSEYQDVTVEVYEESTAKAYELIKNVQTWMESFSDSNSKSASVQLNTIYKDNDTQKKRYRYRGVWRIELF